MSERRSAYIEAAGHEMHVSEWGDPSNPPLIMWHGLARTGRDFDEAASALSDQFFVTCPDTLGRGLSSWVHDHETGYSFPTYAQTALAMIEHYAFDNLRWVGTSMGGLLGIIMAATTLKGRISHLVINDVGPEIPAEGSRRIAEYVAKPPTFDRVSELRDWLRVTYRSFGENTESFWHRMADTSMRRTDAGRISVHYDPRIVRLLDEDSPDIQIWDIYDQVTAKSLLLRGENSDVLTPEVAAEMLTRGPKPRLELIEDCGHAPTLANASQIALLREFLSS